MPRRPTQSPQEPEPPSASPADHSPDDVTARFNAVIESIGREDVPFVRASSRRILTRVEWDPDPESEEG